MGLADNAKLTVELSLKDNLSRGLRGAAGSLSKFDRATSNTQRSLQTTARNVERFAVGVGLATVGLVGATVKAAADYESAFAGVRKTVEATEPQLQKLSDSFRDLAKVIPISADEFARLGEEAGALGIGAGLKDPTEAIKEFTRVTALLGVTTDLTAQDAANSLGILSNVLKLNTQDYSRFASALVALGNAGASTESQIIAIAERAGAAGELIGVSTQGVLAFASAVASVGIESEAGGTAMQKFFVDTAKAVAKGGKDLKTYAKVAGVSAKAFAKAFKEDAGGALQDFLAGLGELTQGEQLQALEDLGFNDARITRTLLGLANNTDLVTAAFDTANESFEENTALTKEAEQRFKTFDSQIIILKNNLRDAAITIGSKLLPKLTPLVQRLTKFIQDNEGKIEEFGTKLADGFEKFADAASKVDWRAIGGGLEITGRAAKVLVDAFLALPPDVQKLAVAALAINKVTGGLPTSIVRDLAGLALRSLTTINAGHVTVVGASVAGGGVPGAPGAGGGGIGGAIGAGVKLIIPAALLTAVVTAVSEDLQSRGAPKGFADIPKNLFAPFLALVDLPAQLDRLLNGPPKPAGGFTGQVANVGRNRPMAILPSSFGPQIAATRTVIGDLKERLARAIANGNEKAATRIRAKLDEQKAKLVALREAQNAAAQKNAEKLRMVGSGIGDVKRAEEISRHVMREAGRETAGKLGTTNDRLAVIARKKTQFNTRVSVNVSTAVSVRETAKATRISSRVARTTSLAAS